MDTYEKHFSRQTIKTLKYRGMKIIGAVAVPGTSGTFLDSETAYQIDDNGTMRLRSYLQIIKETKQCACESLPECGGKNHTIECFGSN